MASVELLTTFSNHTSVSQSFFLPMIPQCYSPILPYVTYPKWQWRLKKKAETWFSYNELELNGDKIQNIIVSSNNRISSTSNIKLLDITIDNMLKWESHIDELCKKPSTQLFLLRQLRKVLSFQILLTYYSYKSDQFGCSLW